MLLRNSQDLLNKQTSTTSLNSDSLNLNSTSNITSNKTNHSQIPRSVSSNSINTNEDIALNNIQQQ